MGERGLDARLQESNRGCLEEQEGGLLGTSGQGGCQSGKSTPFYFQVPPVAGLLVTSI